MDNRVTGMTGHQENPGTGHTLQGKDAPRMIWSRWCGRWASST